MGSSPTRDQTCVLFPGRQILNHWTHEGSPWNLYFYVKPSNSCFCVFFFWLCCVACGILVPWPGIKPMPPTVESESLNHWIARDVLEIFEVLKTHYWKNVQTRQNHWVCWIWSVGHQFATFVQARRQDPCKNSPWKLRLNLPPYPHPTHLSSFPLKDAPAG